MNSNFDKNLPARSGNSENNLINYPRDIYPEELLDQSSGLDLKEFIAVLSRRKKLVITTVMITTLLALIASLLMKPVFRAESIIKVERYAANPNVNILNAEVSRSDRDFFETQIQLIQTKTLARRVIDELKLDTKVTPPGFLKGLFSSNTDSSATTKNKSSTEEVFLENLSVKPINNSQLLKISYDSTDPTLAATISNTIAKAFVKQNLEARFDTATSYKGYVTEAIKVTRQGLEDAENRLNTYAREHNILQASDGSSADGITLKKQLEELVIAEKETIEAEAKYNSQKNNPKGDPASIATNPYILTLKKSAARLESKYKGMRYKRNRTARNLKKEINGIHDQISTESDSIKNSVKTVFLEAQQKEKMLRAQLNNLKKNALKLQSKNTKFNRLQREVEINQLAYNNQLEQLMAVNVASSIGSNNISVIDKATPPNRKFKPSVKTNLVFGALLGLLLGMGIAFLREFMDDSIKDSDALEKLTGLPVLSQLPALKGISHKKIALQTAIEPRSPLAESIRSMRTSLRFSTRSGAPKSTFITSASAAEGKTTVALNLATAYAQAGNNVLLIDADLRNPSLHEVLDLENTNGLTNYLANPEPVSTDISRSCMINQLNVITSGPIPPDPVELLSGSKMFELIESASNHFDHIIIDGPPVLGLADALVLSNLTDATIVTVEAGKTRKTSLLNSLKRLERANANIIGSVITRMNKSVNPSYDQQYYSYSQDTKVAKIGSV